MVLLIYIKSSIFYDFNDTVLIQISNTWYNTCFSFSKIVKTQLLKDITKTKTGDLLCF